MKFQIAALFRLQLDFSFFFFFFSENRISNFSNMTLLENYFGTEGILKRS